MTSFFTLQDGRDAVGRFVETGSCNTTTIDSRINEAVRRLMPKADYVNTTRRIRIRTDQGYFPLPRECEKIIWIDSDGYASRVFNKSYEFLNSGPGELCRSKFGSGVKDLVDDGVHPTMFDVPSIETLDKCCTDRTLGDGLVLVAFSEEQDDNGKEMTIWGLDRLNMDVRTTSSAGFGPGETLAINAWTGGVEGTIDLGYGWESGQTKISNKKYRQVTGWKKPVTKGYVSLYALEVSTNKMFFLGKAHPDDTRPAWRRYRITNQYQSCTTMLALAKLGWVKLTRADDILPIQNLDALKQMIIALREENAANLQGALNYEQNAVRLLNEQLNDHETTGGGPVLVDWERHLMAGGMNRLNV